MLMLVLDSSLSRDVIASHSSSTHANYSVGAPENTYLSYLWSSKGLAGQGNYRGTALVREAPLRSELRGVLVST